MLKKDYLRPLLRKGRAFILAYDHGFEHGAADFNGENCDPEYILQLAVKGKYTGIVLQKGLAEKYYYQTIYQKKIPLILKLNGKTNLFKEKDPYSPVNCSVLYAKKLGAVAVGYTIYLGSEFENIMFAEFGRMQEEAHYLGLGVIAWVYPRGKYIKDEKDAGLVSYTARIGLELGADMIKIKYPGSEKKLARMVKVAGKTKVVIAGGPKLPEKEFYKMITRAVKAGVTGITVGRNVWQSKYPLKVSQQLRKILQI